MKNVLNIGVHSQTLKGADGIVSGSEITTAGLASAFLKRNDVAEILRFSPNNYKGLESGKLNLVIIEGWHATVVEFIVRVRATNPNAIVLFWNLSFYGFNEVVKLDVDGFLSNSKKVASLLNKIKPTNYTMLAADSEVFKPIAPVERYRHDVVYLGMRHNSKSTEIRDRVLYEATNFDLAVYGSGWENDTVIRPFWKGKLPTDDIPLLYSSAKIVLGTTEDRQRKSGMFNNRVFEALSCGALFISEHFKDLEEEFGDAIFYSRQTGDTKKNIKNILQNEVDFKAKKLSARKLIEEEHNYGKRVDQILDFYATVLNGKPTS